MLDFFERAYFAELERKNKLQTALAFPFSVAVVGVTLLAYAVQKWPSGVLNNVPLLLALSASGACIALLVVCMWKFSIGRNYKYIWTLNQMLEHKHTLEQFQTQYPDTPAADLVFEAQLQKDIAFCTSHNSAMNDQRSANLYYANAASLIFVLIAFCFAALVSGLDLMERLYG